MRHSSWTLFLVPLALPLVLLCIPGARRSLDQGDPVKQSGWEYVQTESPNGSVAAEVTSNPTEDSSGEDSEAFFKD